MQKLVYEPKLVARMNERYREFETKEMIRRLRQVKRDARQLERKVQQKARDPRIAA
jgi:hypothetical protein